MSDSGGDSGGESDGGDARGGAASAAGEVGGRPCPVCGRPMVHRHCKYVCPEHGVVYDCSDTFY